MPLHGVPHLLRRRSARAGAALVVAAAALSGCATDGDRVQLLPAAPDPGVSAAAATTPSWNGHVSCSATVTTLAQLLGSQKSSKGGATFAGGGFRPGIPDKRTLTPPCSADGVPTFVEMRRVVVAPCEKLNKDGDWTCTVRDPARPDSPMNRMHIETGSNVRARGGWSVPPAKTLIDVQGFVFWDPGHTGSSWHNYSGWELHSFTAWRRSS